MDGTAAAGLSRFGGSKYNRGLLANVSGGEQRREGRGVEFDFECPNVQCGMQGGPVLRVVRLEAHNMTCHKDLWNTRVAKPDQQLFAVRPLSKSDRGRSLVAIEIAFSDTLRPD